MNDEMFLEFSTILVAKERLARAGLEALLSEKGCRVEQSVDNLDGINWTNQEIFKNNIFVLVDSQTSDGSVFSNISKLIALNSECQILILSGYDNGNYLERCFQHGAMGFILTTSSEDVLLDCMRLIRHGQNVFPSEFVKWVAEGGSGSSDNPEQWARPMSLNNLSEQDTQILQMLVSGLSNKEIGLNFQMPDTAVKILLKKLSHKIGASNRVQAAVWAVKNGLPPYDGAEVPAENYDMDDKIFKAG